MQRPARRTRTRRVRVRRRHPRDVLSPIGCVLPSTPLRRHRAASFAVGGCEHHNALACGRAVQVDASRRPSSSVRHACALWAAVCGAGASLSRAVFRGRVVSHDREASQSSVGTISYGRGACAKGIANVDAPPAHGGHAMFHVKHACVERGCAIAWAMVRIGRACSRPLSAALSATLPVSAWS